jgi:hypothetical protein
MNVLDPVAQAAYMSLLGAPDIAAPPPPVETSPRPLLGGLYRARGY